MVSACLRPPVCVAAAPPRRRGHLVGLGSACVDLLAVVSAYPTPDAKIRSESFEVQGGGNTANALVCSARLSDDGCERPRLFSKLGEDAYAAVIQRELEEEGVDTSAVVHSPGPSPFTYIIVSASEKTRTCIHTPGPPCAAGELTDAAMESLLNGAALVMFDGRLTDAALRLARAADARGVPILVEGERPRPGLDALLSLATSVVTSQTFPQQFSVGTGCFGDAFVEMAARLPRARLIVTTRGSHGSVAVERVAGTEGSGAVLTGAELQRLLNEHDAQTLALPAPGEAPLPRPASPPFLRRAASGDVLRLTLAHAASLHPQSVVDTTGAGDAFIGALAVAVHLHNTPLGDALQLASWVAAAK